MYRRLPERCLNLRRLFLDGLYFYGASQKSFVCVLDFEFEIHFCFCCVPLTLLENFFM